MTIPLNSSVLNFPDPDLKGVWNNNMRKYSAPDNVFCIPNIIPCCTNIQTFGRGTQKEILTDLYRSSIVSGSGVTHSYEDDMPFDEWKIVHMRPKNVIQAEARIISDVRGKIQKMDRTLIE